MATHEGERRPGAAPASASGWPGPGEPQPAPRVTELLERWADGDPSAAAEVMPLVYDELRRIASACLRGERRDHTLDATAIVHEAYLRLVEQNGVRCVDRSHFVGLVVRVMRRVLVEHARRRGRHKRGGDRFRVTLSEADALGGNVSADLIELDDALRDLAAIDPRKSAIVELRFFGGLTIEETAEQMAIGPATVVREWRRARAWLFRELGQHGSGR